MPNRSYISGRLWVAVFVVAFAIVLAVAFLTMRGCGKSPTQVSTPSTAPISLSKGRLPDIDSIYIVTLTKTADPALVLKRHSLKEKALYKRAIKGFSARLTSDQARLLSRDSQVKTIEHDAIVTTQTQEIPPGIQVIGTPASPTAQIDGIDTPLDIDIGVMDTGIDSTHPDLSVYRMVDFTGYGNTNLHFHATHVAGIIGARDNDFGVVGVCPHPRLWSLRVLDPSGFGTYSWLISACDYIVEHSNELAVVNMSLGGTGFSQALADAMKACVDAGVGMVAAAGNNGFDVYGFDQTYGTDDDFLPAAIPEVLTVSAMIETDGLLGGLGDTTKYGLDDQFASFSNYSRSVVGYNPVHSPGAKIDLAAPGANVNSTLPGGTYGKLSGTSMATPHVTGAYALYCLEHGRAFDGNGVVRIRQALIDEGIPQTAWRADTKDRDSNHEPLVRVFPSKVPSSNHLPVVKILLADSTIFFTTNAITLSANAIDAEQGDISSRIKWLSNLDGSLGTGAAISVTLTPYVWHTITAFATDDSLSSGYAVVHVAELGDTLTPSAPSKTKASVNLLYRNVRARVQVSWQDNSSNEQYFEVQQSLGGDFSTVETTPSNDAIGYVWVYSSGTYQYRVRAVTPFHVSDWSRVAKVGVNLSK